MHPPFDILITGGQVIDGSGSPPHRADLGIVGDTIADIGDLTAATASSTLRVLPSACVAPGFVDAHSHSDTYLLADPSASSKIYQGITTEICGNCGASAAPITSLDQLPADWADKQYPETWSSVAEYRELFDRVKPVTNAALLLGHNTLRRRVVGYENRPATDEGMREMIRLAEESLDAGARGLSTGLIYAPGMYAPQRELVALAGLAGERGGVYSSHMRSEGDRLLEAIGEALDIGRRAGARVQISHLKTAGRANWGKLDDALELVRRARTGQAVQADRYPYTRGATELDVVLPGWAAEGGREATLARLADPAQRERLRAELADSRPEDDWQGVTVGSTLADGNRRFRGMTILDIARHLQMCPAEVILHLCETDRLTTGAFFAGMSEENMAVILAEPYVMVGSDASVRSPRGPLSHDFPHPRTYGAFPRFLRMALDGTKIPLAEAVRKMTSLPASQFGLTDRGTLKPGMKADIAVFDPDNVRDVATYADPHRPAEGMDHVIVNGVLTLSNGRLTTHRAGRFL